MEDSQGRDWEQEPEGRSYGEAVAYSAPLTGLMLNELSSITKGHLPRDGHAHSGLGPPKLKY